MFKEGEEYLSKENRKEFARRRREGRAVCILRFASVPADVSWDGWIGTGALGGHKGSGAGEVDQESR